MIIDDDEACLLSAEMIAHNTNYHIMPYLSPVEALLWLERNPETVDIIMVDMMIPEMSGLEFLDRIKSYTKLKDIPVILQSGTSDETKISDAIKKGAIDFISKPYNKENFIKVVEKNIGAV